MSDERYPDSGTSANDTVPISLDPVMQSRDSAPAAESGTATGGPIPPVATGGMPVPPPPPIAVDSSKRKRRHGKVSVFVAGLLGVVLGLGVGGGIVYQVTSRAASGSATSSSATSSGSSGSAITIQASDTDTSTSEAVAAKVSPSVVSVYVYTKESSSYFSSSTSESDTLSALGSGVIISSDGYVVTNAHVVEDADKVTVLIDNVEYDATVVGSDTSTDIAVLKVDLTNLTPITIGDSNNLKVGEWCMTIGSPYGLDESAAAGIVSALYRSTAMTSTSGVSIYANLVQTDAAINSGSSGGALVDQTGALIGISTLTTESGSGIGFAIPVNTVMDIANQLIDNGVAYHSYLGVTLSDSSSSSSSSTGATVASVSSGFAADNAGIKAGDVITKVDGTDISSAAGLVIAIRGYDIGDTVTLTYVRDGQTYTTTCTLSSDQGQSTVGSTSSNSSSSSSSGSSSSSSSNRVGSSSNSSSSSVLGF